MSKSIFSYLYLAAIAAVILALNVASVTYDSVHADELLTVLYLVVGAIVLNRAEVRLDRGRLTLLALPIGAASILLNPLHAAVVGLASSSLLIGRGRWPILANGLMAATYGTLGAFIAGHISGGGVLSLGGRSLVVACAYATSLILVSVGLSIRNGESVRSVVEHSFTGAFYAAFAYFGLAALLVSYVLDGSALGYLLATIVFVLAVALTDTIAGRRIRTVLESELSDADRHLFHSRAVEGVVHNLRNHMATAVGYLKEIDPRRLDPVDREAIETATAAANDAVTVLRSLSQGATPRVSYAPEPIDLNELVSRALAMARPRARTKQVQLALRESPDDVKVKGDPLLLREVATNLVNNAIDAVSTNGRVELSTGKRGNGWPYFSVEDNGPGVSDDNRHHLFEPHFTTKEGGTGLGLFMSYGIVREHQGELTYNGSSRGAVFTVTMPPWPR